MASATATYMATYTAASTATATASPSLGLDLDLDLDAGDAGCGERWPPEGVAGVGVGADSRSSIPASDSVRAE